MTRFHPHFVVGLVGRSGSWKSTVARAVWERFTVPRKATRLCVVHHVADPVFEALERVGVGRNHPEFRRLAQRWGHDLRAVDEDFLVDIQRECITGKSGPTLVVLDGVRYPNDLSLCDLSVKLLCSRPSDLSAEEMLHPSERGWEYLGTDLVFDTDEHAVDAIADFVAEKVREMLK